MLVSPETEEVRQAEIEYWNDKAAGMRSIASDIVAKVLANKSDMEG